MKRFCSLFIAILILVVLMPMGSWAATIYALDGRMAEVDEKEIEKYLELGWYSSFEETVSTLFSNDGRRIEVFKADVSAYLDLGWYENYEDTISELYSMDGRSITVFNSEVPAYRNLGWYEKYEDTVSELYAMDGRRIMVYKSEAPAYLNLGWYEKYEDTVSELYARDGRRITVYKSEVPLYLTLGWYEKYEDTVEMLYARGKEPIVVYKDEVPAFLAVGWSRTRPDGPMIALTFDDGPHARHTDSILNTLSQYGVKATFFVLGSQANSYPAQVQRAYNLGCDIGNHTYSHPNLNTLSSSRVNSEITKTNTIVRNIIGTNPCLLRPPYGNQNGTVRSAAGVPLIIWNVDPEDWKTRSATAVAEHVISRAVDGSIILMHDIYESTAEAVKIIVPALLEKGFNLVTVRELAAAKGVSLQNGTVYHHFK